MKPVKVTKKEQSLRIGIYYDHRFGRNDGPPVYFNHAMKLLGMNINHSIPRGDTLKDIGAYDLHFWVDWGEDALGYPRFDIPNDGGKTIYIASDTHLGRKYRFDLATRFQYVFFNQKRAVEEYTKLYRLNLPKANRYVGWLPHAFNPVAYPNIETLKKYDVAFIGHSQADKPNYNGFSRTQALDRLFKEFPNFYYGSRHPAFPGKNMFEDAAHHFSESKIVFNVSIGDDVNMRVFEVLGTGSFLLTNWLPTLGELFEDGKELVTYKTLDEMVEKAKYYLSHDKERIKIAKAGYNKVIGLHTYQHRVRSILDVIKNSSFT